MESFTTAKPPECGGRAAPKGKGGRPRDPNKIVFVTVGMRQDGWDYLALFGVDSTNTANNPTTQLGNLIERTRLMMPQGPNAFGHAPDPSKPRKVATTPAVAREAARRGMTKAELINELWAGYKANQGDDK